MLPQVRRDFAHVHEAFDMAIELYPQLLLVQKEVVRWEWSKGPRYSLDPMFFCNSGITQAECVPNRPTNLRGYTQYGFHAGGRLILELEYAEFPSPYYRTFYEYLANRVVERRYRVIQSPQVVACSQLILSDCPQYFQRWGELGWTTCSYMCVEQRIVAFAGAAKEHDDEEEQKFSGRVLYKDGMVEVHIKEGLQYDSVLTFRGKSFPRSDVFDASAR